MKTESIDAVISSIVRTPRYDEITLQMPYGTLDSIITELGGISTFAGGMYKTEMTTKIDASGRACTTFNIELNEREH